MGVEALPRVAARLPPLLRPRGAAGLRPLAGRLRGLPRLGEGPRRRRPGTARGSAGWGWWETDPAVPQREGARGWGAGRVPLASSGSVFRVLL